ncbi:tripartite tricarboxylate transporter substrate binding protein [Halarchaeum salinum]|uniref:Tripartite tricarboxylate transporter substrate binding protein n=2 Tax=Halarchaeum salinum TaxID=489912 RepID=A0AAV3S9V5_9EURY
MICPWAAGGGTDRTGRKLASLAGDYMDTSFYVTNKTGGSGSIGFNAIANAEPDGHTVGVTTVEICTISHLGIADVNPTDLRGVIQYNFDPASITVPRDAPYDTIGEFVDYAKDNPGEIKISNSGIGAIWHLSAAGFAQEAGIDVRHIGYDGGSPATKAVVNGEVEATAASAAEVAPQVKDGGPLKVLGVMGDERVSIFQEVPTLKEKGYDFTMGAWRGLTVPKDTPEERITELHDAYKSVYDSNEFQEFMNQNGFGLVYRDTEEFESFMDSEYDRFGEIIEGLDLGNK